MNNVNLLNILGISIEIIGLIVISRADVFKYKLELAENSIPNNILLDRFNAAVNDNPYTPSPEEIKYMELANQDNPNRNFKYFRFGLGCIGLGMVFQLISALLQL